jgi:hypothetical protein
MMLGKTLVFLWFGSIGRLLIVNRRVGIEMLRLLDESLEKSERCRLWRDRQRKHRALVKLAKVSVLCVNNRVICYRFEERDEVSVALIVKASQSRL